MVLKTIFPGCGVRASLMLFSIYNFIFSDEIHIVPFRQFKKDIDFTKQTPMERAVSFSAKESHFLDRPKGYLKNYLKLEEKSFPKISFLGA